MSTQLSNILDVVLLNQLIEQGYINCQQHHDFPLSILNYSHLAQYDPKLVWGEEMNLCRGLIYRHDTMEIIARPFRKFWNLNDTRHPETLEENLPNEQPFMSEKMDGSLGILYDWEGKNYVATRGSFYSEQAQWATKWLNEKFPGLKLPKDYTICVEIIF